MAFLSRRANGEKMILQIRGTSGSGKTTLMREFMGLLPSEEWQERQAIEGRRKPSHYVNGVYAVLGHYESTCGGCDTFKGYEQLHVALTAALRECDHVVMEGLLLSDDVQQTLKMRDYITDIEVYYLTTPIETCIAQVKKRRAEKGKDDVFNETKLRTRYEQIERTKPRLQEAGIFCRHCSYKQALPLIKGVLGL